MKDDLTLIIGAVRYIESQLKEKLSLEDIAFEVGFSKYYFTRLFAKYTGQSPYDYYRGRKLTETIAYMQHHQCKIIDAAFEYGYSSPEVFARACATVFGKPPSAVRKAIEGGTFHGLNPISEGYLWFINNYAYEPVVKVLDRLELGGVGYFTEHFKNPLYRMGPGKLKSLGHTREDPLYLVSWLEPQPMGYMNFVGKTFKEGDSDEGLLIKRLPKMAYLVFEYSLEEGELPYFYDYVYNKYIPESPYEPVMPIHIEVYGIDGGQTSKLYIPIVPKV